MRGGCEEECGDHRHPERSRGTCAGGWRAALPAGSLDYARDDELAEPRPQILAGLRDTCAPHEHDMRRDPERLDEHDRARDQEQHAMTIPGAKKTGPTPQIDVGKCVHEPRAGAECSAEIDERDDR